MARDTVVRARIDGHVKEEATSVLNKMGLSVSDAIRMLLIRVAREKALPFDVRIPKRDMSDIPWFSNPTGNFAGDGRTRGTTGDQARDPHYVGTPSGLPVIGASLPNSGSCHRASSAAVWRVTVESDPVCLRSGDWKARWSTISHRPGIPRKQRRPAAARQCRGYSAAAIGLRLSASTAAASWRRGCPRRSVGSACPTTALRWRR